jgi:hypothetical protein
VIIDQERSISEGGKGQVARYIPFTISGEEEKTKPNNVGNQEGSKDKPLEETKTEAGTLEQVIASVKKYWQIIIEEKDMPFNDESKYM